ncbi:UNVERIFIED_ORG: thiaminase/transcriptional activator TenA [Nocardia globerula]|uniref:Thiaminase/transcriptional activator TenA n=1 Tax=Nocardia globerula TaxID=1818 RepID=A0A652YIJ0_NOCGL|nr:TenA family protein [Rhodococcus globerulus]PVX66707.1 thiaminase/transcriptional activator TenA [Rhodococcus globerulus]
MATTQPAYSSAENTSVSNTALIESTSDRFTDRLWDETKVLRESIDSLEFLRRLGDGTLPLDAFRTYIEQDKLYLEGYSQALSLVAAHAPNPQAAGFWSNSASTAATVESSLHDGLLTGGILPTETSRLEHSQACLGYVSYLIATAATAPYAVSAAAVLPCFWIYAEVGRDLAASAREVLDADPTHPYAQWVSTWRLSSPCANELPVRYAPRRRSLLHRPRGLLQPSPWQESRLPCRKSSPPEP